MYGNHASGNRKHTQKLLHARPVSKDDAGTPAPPACLTQQTTQSEGKNLRAKFRSTKTQGPRGGLETQCLLGVQGLDCQRECVAGWVISSPRSESGDSRIW